MKLSLALCFVATMLLSGCSSSEEQEASKKPSADQWQSKPPQLPVEAQTAANHNNLNTPNEGDPKVVFEEDDYPVIFGTDTANIFKNPQGENEPVIKL
ncbi:MAG: hypothetical protein KDA70_08145, partial [Planctomycetaceae bacterium]|nr:hypothetical protein [Planctomycetaceae bacterium]